jgi:hypothetical protein
MEGGWHLDIGFCMCDEYEVLYEVEGNVSLWIDRGSNCIYLHHLYAKHVLLSMNSCIFGLRIIIMFAAICGL